MLSTRLSPRAANPLDSHSVRKITWKAQAFTTKILSYGEKKGKVTKLKKSQTESSDAIWDVGGFKGEIY